MTWLAAGLVTGLLLAALLWLRMESQAPAMAPAAPVAPATPLPVSPVEPEAPDPLRERFQFYDLLPRQEVVVPGRAEERRAPPPAAAAPPSGQYMLQAGSFRRHADADGVKARLAMLGIQASIESVTLEGSEMHRVRIGPLRDTAEVERVRERLSREQIDVFVQRVGD